MCVLLHPLPQMPEGNRGAMAEPAQFVFDAGWDFGIDGSCEKAVGFKAFERVRENLWAHAGKAFGELPESLWAFLQGANCESTPFVRQQVEHVSTRTHCRIDVVSRMGIAAFVGLVAQVGPVDRMGLVARASVVCTGFQ